MGRRTLKNQLRHVVCSSKRLGHSKRAEKKNGVKVDQYLYSINSTKKMFAFCNKFSDWMKQNHPEIKWVKDISSEHLQEYCDSHLDYWSNATRKEYQSRIHKLGLMVSNTYQLNKDYTDVEIKRKSPIKSNNKPMDPNDFKKLSEAILKKNSYARFIPDIAARIGSRSEETRSITPEDIDLEKHLVHLRNCKNGKYRDVPIRDKDLNFFIYLNKYLKKNNWSNVCNGISENSCNRIIRKTMRECGISDKYRQSIHAIRKMYAVERMKELQQTGTSRRDAWCVVQTELGHGSRFRSELAQVYLGDNSNF